MNNVSSRGMGALQLEWSVTIETFLSVIDVECKLAVWEKNKLFSKVFNIFSVLHSSASLGMMVLTLLPALSS